MNEFEILEFVPETNRRDPINGFEALGVGVLPSPKRQGVGTMLTSNLLQLTQTDGFQSIEVNVFSDNVLSVRGQSTTPYNNHTLILLNGRPVRDPITGGLNGAVFTSFPLDIIDHIEVIR